MVVKKNKSKTSSITTALASSNDKDWWGFQDNSCLQCGKRNSELSGLFLQCAMCKDAYFCSGKCFQDGYPQHSVFCRSGETLGHIPTGSDSDPGRIRPKVEPTEDGTTSSRLGVDSRSIKSKDGDSTHSSEQKKVGLVPLKAKEVVKYENEHTEEIALNDEEKKKGKKDKKDKKDNKDKKDKKVKKDKKDKKQKRLERLTTSDLVEDESDIIQEGKKKQLKKKKKNRKTKTDEGSQLKGTPSGIPYLSLSLDEQGGEETEVLEDETTEVFEDATEVCEETEVYEEETEACEETEAYEETEACEETEAFEETEACEETEVCEEETQVSEEETEIWEEIISNEVSTLVEVTVTHHSPLDNKNGLQDGEEVLTDDALKVEVSELLRQDIHDNEPGRVTATSSGWEASETLDLGCSTQETIESLERRDNSDGRISTSKNKCLHSVVYPDGFSKEDKLVMNPREGARVPWCADTNNRKHSGTNFASKKKALYGDDNSNNSNNSNTSETSETSESSGSSIDFQYNDYSNFDIVQGTNQEYVQPNLRRSLGRYYEDKCEENQAGNDARPRRKSCSAAGPQTAKIAQPVNRINGVWGVWDSLAATKNTSTAKNSYSPSKLPENRYAFLSKSSSRNNLIPENLDRLSLYGSNLHPGVPVKKYSETKLSKRWPSPGSAESTLRRSTISLATTVPFHEAETSKMEHSWTRSKSFRLNKGVETVKKDHERIFGNELGNNYTGPSSAAPASSSVSVMKEDTPSTSEVELSNMTCNLSQSPTTDSESKLPQRHSYHESAANLMSPTINSTSGLYNWQPNRRPSSSILRRSKYGGSSLHTMNDSIVTALKTEPTMDCDDEMERNGKVTSHETYTSSVTSMKREATPAELPNRACGQRNRSMKDLDSERLHRHSYHEHCFKPIGTFSKDETSSQSTECSSSPIRRSTYYETSHRTSLTEIKPVVKKEEMVPKKLDWTNSNYLWTRSSLLRSTEMGEVLITKGDIALPGRPDVLLQSGKVARANPEWTSRRSSLKKVDGLCRYSNEAA